MKAINVVENDGYKVVRSVGKPTLDPVATKKKAHEALKSSPEGLEFLSLLQEVRSFGGDPSIKQDIISRATPLYTKLRKLEAEHMSKNPVFFDTMPNEVNVPDEEGAKLSDALKNLQPHETLLLDGRVIPDYQGVEVWTKTKEGWVRDKIRGLGTIPRADQILTKDLTSEHRREIIEQENHKRLLALPEAQLTAEEDKHKSAALGESIAMRQTLEIKGDLDALYKSQKHYLDRVEAIEARFRGIRDERERNP